MGVCVTKCNKDSEKVLQNSVIECFKRADQSNYAITMASNDLNIQERNMEKMKYKKMFNNNNKKRESTLIQKQKDENYIKNVIKIQKFYRNYIKLKKDKEKIVIEENKQEKSRLKRKEKVKEEEKEKEDSLVLKLNLEMVETVISSNSLNNSNISKENIINIDKTLIKNISIPFNIKNKLNIMQHKFSGYLKKKRQISNGENLNSSGDKEIISNDENFIKEGFGKFIFSDGSEFFGIFHNNIFQKFGKYVYLNQKEEINNNMVKNSDKEIYIAENNINYSEFMGEYKNYIPDGFGIYTNLITNLKISGNFGANGIDGIGIEHSVEGHYIYEGEFQNNKKQGLGTIIWEDGSKYQGEFKNNQMNGIGMIQFPEKNSYQGEIKNGKMDGFGEFFWNDKKKYVGFYKNDKREGFGVFIFKNSDIQYDFSDFDHEFDVSFSSAYIGSWKNGNMDGFGMTIVNSEIKYGIWENGFKKKSLESNETLQSYAKWMNKNFNKLFLAKPQNVLDFLADICNINSEIVKKSIKE